MSDRVYLGRELMRNIKPKPVYWKPRYATRSMRERAWAKADLRREEAMKHAPHGRSFLARLLGR